MVRKVVSGLGKENGVTGEDSERVLKIVGMFSGNDFGLAIARHTSRLLGEVGKYILQNPPTILMCGER